jgi:hypothetical protein
MRLKRNLRNLARRAALAAGAVGALALSGPARGGRFEERPARAVVPRAKAAVTMDGRMTEWAGAFSVPVNAGHVDWPNRAAVWSLLWDAENLYVGLRCLDEKIFNSARGAIPGGGDGVEFYLDTRAGADLGKGEWTAGTLHLFYAPATDAELKARVQLRGGIPAFQNLKLEGAEAASSKTADGYELEFRLPWKLFPEFKPEAGREIGLDLELSSGDGGQRVVRCWIFSGVEAVGSPAVFGRVRLVESWDPAAARDYSEVLFPAMVARSNTAGAEPAFLAVGISPALQPLVQKVELTVSGRPLPMTGVKSYGPGWARIQTCLVGFTNPQDKANHLRALAADGRVLGERDIPLAP